MATNNNLRDWASAFKKVLTAYQFGIVLEQGDREARGRTTRNLERGGQAASQSRREIYTLRTQLPGVLTISGLKPAEISTIVAAFDKIIITPENFTLQNLAIRSYTQWFDRNILPRTK